MRWLIDDSIRYKQSGSFEDVVYAVRYCFEETGSSCIEGQHKQSIINKLNELNIDRVDTWESFYNKKWTTFIKIK